MRPTRRISTDSDLALFQSSAAYQKIVDFVGDLNASVRGYDVGLSPEPSENILKVVDIIRQVSSICDLHPTSENSSRFGKPEFRDFYDEVSHRAPELLNGLDLADPEEAGTYFVESWGNRERIDYGSGHELNFLAFLIVLDSRGLFRPSDRRDLALGVFSEYLKTMRKVQQTYWLEPAGSHGVWGLDDYHFLPFLLGSGQLVDHKYLRPMSIHDRDLVDMFGDKNFYFGAIKFINSVKSASLRWHSPMLDDISGVKKWAKVNEGMIKMYKAEVLGKLPIMQHFMFGEALAASEGMTPADKVTDEHQHNGWGDCCGIKVPSAIAANQGSSGLRVLPFD